MVNVENVDVWGFEHAIRGMRNPLSSWAKSDSGYEYEKHLIDDGNRITGYWTDPDPVFVLGDADLKLMRKLYKAGTEHRKYLRQIFVSMDITAPLYWWKEADTYKVGTTANSCSTMHTIHKTGITFDSFSLDGGIALSPFDEDILNEYIHMLERLRLSCKSGDEIWRTLIQLLPESFNQKRTVTMSYENVVSIIKQRSGHKLNEWQQFVEQLKNLPYINDIMQ